MAELDDAIAFWKPVDYSGSGDLLDGSGNNYDFTINGPDWDGTDKHFTFVPANSDYMEGDDWTAFDIGTSDILTVLVIVKPKTITSVNVPIMSKLNTGAVNGWFCGQYNGYGRTYLRDTVDTVSEYSGNVLDADTNIFNIASVIETTEVETFVDGTGSTAASRTTIGDMSNAVKVVLGNYGNLYSSGYWGGDFYGAAVWDSVKSGTELETAATELLTAGSGDGGLLGFFATLVGL